MPNEEHEVFGEIFAGICRRVTADVGRRGVFESVNRFMRSAKRRCKAPGSKQPPVRVCNGVTILVAEYVGETGITAREKIVQL